MTEPGSDGLNLYTGLPVLRAFRDLADPRSYTALPDGWIVGVADLVGSTGAIAAGRYKSVNAAAASVIAALANALSNRDFPFVFGGDGASFALPASFEPTARETLAAVVRWVAENFDMTLRAAILPVRTIRESGHDVRVARFGPSPDVAYAMFDGGGLAFAEAQMKAGAFAVDPAIGLERPDLSGLSCRFAEIPAKRGVILSIIALPQPDTSPDAFERIASDLLALTDENPDAGNPLPPGGPPLAFPPAGLDLEARAASAATGRPLALSRARTMLRALSTHLLFRWNIPIGGFDPERYRRELVQNTDFRKFDDGLRMTIDCTPALADRIEDRLAAAQDQGAVRYGTFRQEAALMTCFVPSASRSDHIHFIDGAAGGYAQAAALLKRGAALAA